MTEVAVPSICNLMHRQSSALFLRCLRTMLPHTLSCKALYQRWSSALLTVTINSIEGYVPQLRILQMEMAQLYVLCFYHMGKLLKISRWSKKQFIYLWEKGDAEPASHSLEGKKNQPSLNSLFGLFNSMLWSECRSLQSILWTTVTLMDPK